MTIKNANLTFKSMSKRSLSAIKTVVLHHAAAKSCTIQEIHKWHLAKGWAGCGYHYFVRKNGEVWQGRPLDRVGAHCSNNNTATVGICFEGNFDAESMPSAQIKAGQELIEHIKKQLGNLPIKRHKDFNSTACPGKNFPLNSFTGVTATSTTSTASSCPYAEPKVNLKRGSKGTGVKWMQWWLNRKGYSLAVDGDFGLKTAAAVNAFQRANKLVVDGIVGVKTRAKLKG